MRVTPDSITTQVGLTGTLAAISDDPTAPDGSWLTSTAGSSTELAVTFPNPGTLAGEQVGRMLLRKTSQASLPTATVEARVGLTTVATWTGEISGPTVVEVRWTGTAVPTLRMVGTVGGGKPADRAAVEVGAVDWVASIGATPPPVHSGPLDLTGAGDLTTSGAPAMATTLALSGDGVLEQTGSLSTSGQLATVGDGTLALAGDAPAPDHAAALELGGDGTLTLAGGLHAGGPLTLASIGALDLAGRATTTALLTLAGSGDLTLAAEVEAVQVLTLASEGTLTTTGSVAATTSLGLLGDGSLVGAGQGGATPKPPTDIEIRVKPARGCHIVTQSASGNPARVTGGPS